MMTNVTEIPHFEVATDMELAIRIGDYNPSAEDKNFRADMAL